ncbi:MAG: hypothetical protein ACM3YE_14440 [Bacteroidota bacterium]
MGLNISEIIHEEGILGFISGFLIIMSLYLSGYPILLTMNFIRICRQSGYKAAKEQCLLLTKKSIGIFVGIAGASIFLIIPLSIIPLGIGFSIISLIISLFSKYQFGQYFEEVLIVYLCFSLIITLFYAIYQSSKQSPLEEPKK